MRVALLIISVAALLMVQALSVKPQVRTLPHFDVAGRYSITLTMNTNVQVMCWLSPLQRALLDDAVAEINAHRGTPEKPPITADDVFKRFAIPYADEATRRIESLTALLADPRTFAKSFLLLDTVKP